MTASSEVGLAARPAGASRPGAFICLMAAPRYTLRFLLLAMLAVAWIVGAQIGGFPALGLVLLVTCIGAFKTYADGYWRDALFVVGFSSYLIWMYWKWG
jgi:hypothetical protein